MKIFKFLLSLLALLGALYLLNFPAKIGEDTIPPVGHFFNPFGGFWQNAEPVKTAGMDENLQFPERKGKVKILFDERLVPHIFAENLEDALFAQGYVTAKYRLWQMDLVSRLAAGRLSEVMGEKTLETDKLQRRRGMLYGAQKAAESWQKSPETKRLIDAYVEGVNAFTQNLPEAKRPLEFKLLNYQPEAWSMLKTALVKKYMDQTLCSAESDLESSNALQVLGPELFQQLYPTWNPKQSPVIPAGTSWNFEPAAAKPATELKEAVGLFDHEVFEKLPENIGSNNWAVSGEKTASGSPILCNDPHLQLSLPSIWFEIQIHTPEMNAYGVSIPGMPGVIIGFNETSAWGTTNVGHDVADWYRIAWTDAARTSYQFEGGVKQAELVVEKYVVKDDPAPRLDTVRWTAWGPVVYEGKTAPKHDLAFRWLAHDAPNPDDLLTFLGFDRNKGYADYKKAVANYDFPAQNFVFASQNGDIAMTVTGKFPIKNKEQGRFVQDGGSAANGWSAFVPKEHLPRSFNPQRGFVASANQHSTDPSYPYYYNSGVFDDYRGRYLAGQLGDMKKITVEDMQALQNSTFSLEAKEATAALLATLPLDSLQGREREIAAKLATWDFRYEADKIEPAIFEVWWSKFYDATFDEVMAWKDSIPILMPEKWRLVDLLEKSPGDAIFDDKKTSARETAFHIARASLQQTATEMADDLVNPAFNWASKKNTSIMHLARLAAFSKMNIQVGGAKNALNAISETHGPSWRMVVDVGKEVRGWGVFPGGQSGNPGSPYYATGLEKWTKGEYNELFFMKNDADERQPLLFSITIN